jgi:hypothetical protein
LNLWEVVVRPVGRLEEHRFQVFAGLAKVTAPKPTPPKWFSSNPHSPMLVSYCRDPFSSQFIVQEVPKSGSLPKEGDEEAKRTNDIKMAIPLLNYDEDRSRIRIGYGPENITRLRRFAIEVIKSKGAASVAQKMRQLTRNVRMVFDYLRMTENSCTAAHP